MSKTRGPAQTAIAHAKLAPATDATHTLCPVPGTVSVSAGLAELPPAHQRLLAQLAAAALSDDAFVAALLVVPLLDFQEVRRLPHAGLRRASGLDAARWSCAIKELVVRGALHRSWPRWPNRRVPAYTLAQPTEDMARAPAHPRGDCDSTGASDAPRQRRR